MKIIFNTLTAIFCGLLLVNCQPETGYKIQGNLPGAPDQTVVYLQFLNTDQIDSTQIQDGKFVFTGKVNYPEFVQIQTQNPHPQQPWENYAGGMFWLDNSNLSFECPYDSLPFVKTYSPLLKISGSQLVSEYEEYQSRLSTLSQQRKKFWEEYIETYLKPAAIEKELHTQAGIAVMRQLNEVSNQIVELQRNFITTHPKSAVSVEILSDLLRKPTTLTSEEFTHMLNHLDSSLYILPNYQELRRNYEKYSALTKGQKFTDVTLTTLQGDTVLLSSYIQPGKYTLVEVWASWCSPCRGEIPHLRHVYKNYGELFNMVSVSIDEKEQNWQKALKEEKMPWTQLRSPHSNPFESEIAQAYKLDGVPYTLLLDPQGKIVDMDLRGSALDVVLVDLYGDKFKD